MGVWRMKLSEGALTPLYQQVMGDIKDDIDRGRYAQGDKIPSEAELSDIYSVSRITVRRAVTELVGEGYLTKKQGKGTFVNRHKLARKLQQTNEVQSFTDTCSENGRTAGAKMLGVAVTKARAGECEFLGFVEGAELVHVKRLRTADGVPIMLENCFYPLNGFEFLLEADLTDRSIFKVVEEKSGRRPESDDLCTLEIVRASPEVADILKVTIGDPLFLETIYFIDQDHRPFFIGKQYIVGSLYVFNI